MSSSEKLVTDVELNIKTVLFGFIAGKLNFVFRFLMQTVDHHFHGINFR